jgi:mannose/fructose/N-acetylgalactosamine-specific phosphotransferase system component IIB
MSLVLARIDDRLVHGQVVLVWGNCLSATSLLVADDAVAANPWERELMGTTAENMEVEVVAIAELPARLELEEERGGATILLLRSPAAALAAVEAGAAIDEMNLGGLHFAPGKEKILDYIYLNEADRLALTALQERGVRLIAQDVPASRPIDAREFLTGGEGA